MLVVASYPGNAIVEVWAEDEEHALELAVAEAPNREVVDFCMNRTGDTDE